jgi:hypothetical protein
MKIIICRSFLFLMVGCAYEWLQKIQFLGMNGYGNEWLLALLALFGWLLFIIFVLKEMEVPSESCVNTELIVEQLQKDKEDDCTVKELAEVSMFKYNLIVRSRGVRELVSQHNAGLIDRLEFSKKITQLFDNMSKEEESILFSKSHEEILKQILEDDRKLIQQTRDVTLPRPNRRCAKIIHTHKTNRRCYHTASLNDEYCFVHRSIEKERIQLEKVRELKKEQHVFNATEYTWKTCEDCIAMLKDLGIKDAETYVPKNTCKNCKLFFRMVEHPEFPLTPSESL